MTGKATWRLAAGSAMLAAGFLAGGCRAGGAATSRPAGGAAVRAVVSIAPQGYFLHRLGGPHVHVSVLVPPGSSSHTYEPAPRQISELAQARLFFRVGAPFERRLADRIAANFPNLRLVDTRQGIALLPMTRAGHDEDEGPAAAAGDRGEEGLDPHIWLDPVLVKQQAATMAAALAQADPAHQRDYEANLHAFQRDLDAVDAELRQTLAPLKGKTFFVFHPAFGYFARRYGLVQAPVEIEGKEPSARQIGKLIDRAKAAGARVIFVQPQFSTKAAAAIAQAIGGAVVPMDPQAEDYLANLRRMAAAIRKALGGPT